jgi:hypothetical protein
MYKKFKLSEFIDNKLQEKTKIAVSVFNISDDEKELERKSFCNESFIDFNDIFRNYLSMDYYGLYVVIMPAEIKDIFEFKKVNFNSTKYYPNDPNPTNIEKIIYIKKDKKMFENIKFRIMKIWAKEVNLNDYNIELYNDLISDSDFPTIQFIIGGQRGNKKYKAIYGNDIDISGQILIAWSKNGRSENHNLKIKELEEKNKILAEKLDDIKKMLG